MKGLACMAAAFAAGIVGSAATVEAQEPINWGDNAVHLRSFVGRQFRFVCPGGGSAHTVWGTDVYTDDSSICTAGVHAGAIGWGGGLVTIQIAPGQSSYPPSMRNGVSSQTYGPWTGSFFFVGVRPAGDPASWQRNAQSYSGPGPFSLNCSPGGVPGSVWGTDYYTSDSSICTAAVHAGVITLASGGTVTFFLHGGLPSYPGSFRNGITTSSWGAYGSTFAFTPNPPMMVRTIAWSTDGASVVQPGQSVMVTCPMGGSPGRVWGTDIYTSDSSVCTAAVHMGVIDFRGGTIAVTWAPGQPSYRASMRYGVASDSWGSWGNSFLVAPAR